LITKNINLKTVKPARKYAEAFFEVIKDKDSENSLLNIKKLNDFISSDEKTKTFFYHPVIEAADKKETLKKIFPEFSSDTMNFVFVLIDENRLNCLNEIENFLREKINAQNKVLLADITVAYNIKEEQKEYIKNRLQNKFNKQIEPNFIKDESIIGGMLIKLNDTVIDLSIKKKLENFKTI